MIPKRTLITSLLLLTLTGCTAPTVFVWSPDGSRLAVIGRGYLYVTDAEGRRIADSSAGEITGVAWHLDSRHLAVAAGKTLDNWEQCTKVLSDAQQEDWSWLAERVLVELKRAKGFNPLNEASPSATFNGVYGNGRRLLATYLRDHGHEKEVKKLRYSWRHPSEALPRHYYLQLVELTGTSSETREILHETMNDLAAPTVSPDGKWFTFLEYDAFAKRGDERSPFFHNKTLWITSRGAKPQLIADDVEFTPCWSADSTELAYASSGNQKMRVHPLIVLGIQQIPPEHPMTEKSAEAVLLLGVYARCDFIEPKRLLFAASETKLPTSEDAFGETQLYTLSIQEGAKPEKLTADPLPEEAVKALANASYILSPNRERMAIVGMNGQVWTLELTTGRLQLVQPKKSWKNVGIMPSWRNNDKLSFAVPPGSEHGSPQRVEIVLWTKDGVRCLSKDWPDEMLSGLSPEGRSRWP